MTPYDIPDILRVDEIVVDFLCFSFFEGGSLQVLPTANRWNSKKELCRCLELPLRVMVRWQSLCCVEYCRVV